MPELTFRALKAENGDALIVLSEEVSVVIDGGPHGVYDQVLRDQIMDLPDRRGTGPAIDLVMVSHIDDDHIIGVKELAEELQHRGFAEILEIWRNSFQDEEILRELPDRSAPAALASSGMRDFLRDLIAAEDECQSALASVASARELDDVIGEHVRVNPDFANDMVLRENAPDALQIGDLSFVIVGPTQVELERLKRKWAEDLPKILAREAKEAEAKLAAVRLDRSASNLASIVAILNAVDKRILLTGDARTDHIESWLEDMGQLDEDGTHFDIIKIPHHGSKRNNTVRFYDKVTADHYVFSGNGGHGNPDPSIIQMIADSRGDADFMIHLTYDPESIAAHKDMGKKGKSEPLLALVSQDRIRSRLSFPNVDEDFLDIVLSY